MIFLKNFTSHILYYNFFKSFSAARLHSVTIINYFFDYTL